MLSQERLPLIRRRVGHAGLAEPLQPQRTTVATPTGPPLLIRVVTAERPSVINPEPQALPDDLGLGPAQERRMDPKRPQAFDPGLRRQVRQPLELLQELRPAIRIAAVVDGVGPDE